MKAIVHREYGSPAGLRLEDVETPAVPDDGVLVRVSAASVNPIDWYTVTGTPYVARMVSGLRRPKAPALGVDFAGTVDAVGGGVTKYRPGDRVFGRRSGAFAEYVCVPEDQAIAPMPANLSFEQAAAVPVAAGTALEGLRDKGHLRPGQQVLINGASGGVGTFAVQIAKSLGAQVTGVCSTRNVDLVRSLGADHVVDYTREDFTRAARRYDLVFDIAGSRTWSAYTRVLKPRAAVVVVGGPKTNRWLGPLGHFAAVRLAALPGRRTAALLMATVDRATLLDLRELLEAGKLTPVVDRQYPLSNIADALRYLGEGHAPGKVVITV